MKWVILPVVATGSMQAKLVPEDRGGVWMCVCVCVDVGVCVGVCMGE